MSLDCNAAMEYIDNHYTVSVIIRDTGEELWSTIYGIESMRKSELRERIVFNLIKKTDTIKHAKIDINISNSVLYINAVESTVKGVGALLLYIAACKAKALRLPVKFVAIPGLDYGRPGRLFEHYNSLHFKRDGSVTERERDGPSQWYKTEGRNLDDLILKKVHRPSSSSQKKTRKNRGNARNSRNRTDL